MYSISQSTATNKSARLESPAEIRYVPSSPSKDDAMNDSSWMPPRFEDGSSAEREKSPIAGRKEIVYNPSGVFVLDDKKTILADHQDRKGINKPKIELRDNVRVEIVAEVEVEAFDIQQEPQQQTLYENKTKVWNEEKKKLLSVLSSAAEKAKAEKAECETEIMKLQKENQKLKEEKEVEKEKYNMQLEENKRLLEENQEMLLSQSRAHMETMNELSTELSELKAEYIEKQLQSHMDTADLIGIKVDLEQVKDEINEFSALVESSSRDNDQGRIIEKQRDLIVGVVENTITSLGHKLLGYDPEEIHGEFDGKLALGVPRRFASSKSFRGKLADSEYFDGSKKPWLTSVLFNKVDVGFGRSRPDNQMFGSNRSGGASSRSESKGSGDREDIRHATRSVEHQLSELFALVHDSEDRSDIRASFNRIDSQWSKLHSMVSMVEEEEEDEDFEKNTSRSEIAFVPR